MKKDTITVVLADSSMVSDLEQLIAGICEDVAKVVGQEGAEVKKAEVKVMSSSEYAQAATRCRMPDQKQQGMPRPCTQSEQLHLLLGLKKLIPNTKALPWSSSDVFNGSDLSKREEGSSSYRLLFDEVARLKCVKLPPSAPDSAPHLNSYFPPLSSLLSSLPSNWFPEERGLLNEMVDTRCHLIPDPAHTRYKDDLEESALGEPQKAYLAMCKELLDLGWAQRMIYSKWRNMAQQLEFSNLALYVHEATIPAKRLTEGPGMDEVKVKRFQVLVLMLKVLQKNPGKKLDFLLYDYRPERLDDFNQFWGGIHDLFPTDVRLILKQIVCEGNTRTVKDRGCCKGTGSCQLSDSAPLNNDDLRKIARMSNPDYSARDGNSEWEAYVGSEPGGHRVLLKTDPEVQRDLKQYLEEVREATTLHCPIDNPQLARKVKKIQDQLRKALDYIEKFLEHPLLSRFATKEYVLNHCEEYYDYECEDGDYCLSISQALKQLFGDYKEAPRLGQKLEDAWKEVIGQAAPAAAAGPLGDEAAPAAAAGPLGAAAPAAEEAEVAGAPTTSLRF